MQLSDRPTDSSFSILVENQRLDIVAPTSSDFQVWYFGLAFATRLRMNALAEGDQLVSVYHSECLSLTTYFVHYVHAYVWLNRWCKNAKRSNKGYMIQMTKFESTTLEMAMRGKLEIGIWITL
jgi:hypothetical protein